MRRILVDQARKKLTANRGAGAQATGLSQRATERLWTFSRARLKYQMSGAVERSAGCENGEDDSERFRTCTLQESHPMEAREPIRDRSCRLHRMTFGSLKMVRSHALPGIEDVSRWSQTYRQLLVGGQGVPVEEFLSQPAPSWLR